MASLNLSKNIISEAIPDKLINLKEFKYLNLSNNNIYGKLPSEFEELDRLFHIKLDNNPKLKGLIDGKMCNSDNLKLKIKVEKTDIIACQ